MVVLSLYGSRCLSVTPLAGVERQGSGFVGGGGGVFVPFLSAPPLSAEPIPFLSYVPSLGFYSWLFVVMKAPGSWGPVIVLSTLNRSPQDSLQDGDPSVCAERRLEGVHRLEGLLLASSNISGQPQVPQICDLE